MKTSDEYLTIARPSSGYYKEKGSKFIAFAFPVNSIEQINDILKRLKKEHHSAHHHCYAYSLQKEKIEYRINDDGEPVNTAGKSILQQIASRNLTNILVLVVRYFGGILLGKGGLARAYKNAASEALDKAAIIPIINKEIYRIRFDYKDINSVMKIINENDLEMISQKYEKLAQIEFSVREKISLCVINQFKLFDKIEVEYLGMKQD